MAADPDLRDVLLKVRYPGEPVRDDLALSIGERLLFVSTEDATTEGTNITLTIEFPGLLAPVELSARMIMRVAGNPAAGQASGMLLELRPASDVERERLTALLARLRASDGASRAEPFRLLLVDDSELAHKVISSAVARMQRTYAVRVVEVVNATSVAAAVELLGRERVDMALVDHWMPERTGDELVRLIRADPAHRTMPILVVSEGGREVRDTVLRAGADLVLDKPLMLKPLLATITALVTSMPGGAAP